MEQKVYFVNFFSNYWDFEKLNLKFPIVYIIDVL